MFRPVQVRHRMPPRHRSIGIAQGTAAFTRRGNARSLSTGVLQPVGFSHWGWEPAFGREVGTLVRGLAEKSSHSCDGVFTGNQMLQGQLALAGLDPFRPSFDRRSVVHRNFRRLDGAVSILVRPCLCPPLCLAESVPCSGQRVVPPLPHQGIVNNIWKCPVQVTSELSGVACPLQARWSNGRWRVTCHQG